MPPAPPKPLHCRPRAFDRFAEQLPLLGTTAGLVRTVSAVSAHELDGINPERVQRQVEELTERVRERVVSRHPEALLAHAHTVLFDEAGFRGDRAGYYDPVNSYLPMVLSRRRGLPITLSLIYKAVVEPLGLAVEGINAPGHFLARVRLSRVAAVPDSTGARETGPGHGHGDLLVDPFDGGRVLTEAEVYQRIELTIGPSGTHVDQPLAPATHRQWVERVLTNLANEFQRQERSEDVAAMLELARLLELAP